MRKTVTVTVTLDKPLLRELDKMATEQGLTRSELIQRMVRDQQAGGPKIEETVEGLIPKLRLPSQNPPTAEERAESTFEIINKLVPEEQIIFKSMIRMLYELQQLRAKRAADGEDKGAD